MTLTRLLMVSMAVIGGNSVMMTDASAACSLSVQGVNFGSYDVFNVTPTDSTGNIDVACTVRTNFTVTLGTGAGTYSSRQARYGARSLHYNLFRNAARTRIWGDGTAGTVVQSANARVRNFTVYGRIPAQQNVYAGNYSDNVIVTVIF